MACSGPKYDLAWRFVGTWKEYTITPEGESLIGTLQVNSELDGCLITQHFQAGDGDLAFTAFGYFDSESNNWQETYIFNNGGAAHYRWEESGDEVIINRLGEDPNNKRRFRIQNLTHEAYDVLNERSSDGGQTWELVQAARTRREG